MCRILPCPPTYFHERIRCRLDSAPTKQFAALHGAGLEEPGTGGLDGLGCQTGFGWVAETRETGKGPEPGHRLALDPAVKSPVTIPPERAMNPFLRSALFL